MALKVVNGIVFFLLVHSLHAQSNCSYIDNRVHLGIGLFNTLHFDSKNLNYDFTLRYRMFEQVVVQFQHLDVTDLASDENGHLSSSSYSESNQTKIKLLFNEKMNGNFFRECGFGYSHIFLRKTALIETTDGFGAVYSVKPPPYTTSTGAVNFNYSLNFQKKRWLLKLGGEIGFLTNTKPAKELKQLPGHLITGEKGIYIGGCVQVYYSLFHRKSCPSYGVSAGIGRKTRNATQ